MPNRLTRIPDGPVPALPRLVQLLLPLADGFMLVMLSRPKTGSLRNTWVTPATLWLSLAVAIGLLPVAIFGLAAGGPAPALLGAAGVVLAVGGLSVAVVGFAQRRGRTT